MVWIYFQISEGYSAIRSTSLAENLCDELMNTNLQNSSAGYFSMLDFKDDGKLPPLNSFMGASLQQVDGLSPYSRHSFTPPNKFDNLHGGKTGSLPRVDSSYVTAAFADTGMPQRVMPSTTNDTSYVSFAYDPTIVCKQPSSPLNFMAQTNDEDLPPGAYCKVGSHNSRPKMTCKTNTQELPPAPQPNHGYVSFDHANSFNATIPSNESRVLSDVVPDVADKRPNLYVSVGDGEMWAMPVESPLQNEGRNISSAPSRGSHDRAGQPPRPNTTENVSGEGKLRSSTPMSSVHSSSRISSGYTSQGSLTSYDPVVMSPRELIVQTSEPHSVVLSPSHRVSMV